MPCHSERPQAVKSLSTCRWDGDTLEALDPSPTAQDMSFGFCPHASREVVGGAGSRAADMPRRVTKPERSGGEEPPASLVPDTGHMGQSPANFKVGFSNSPDFNDIFAFLLRLFGIVEV